MLPLSGLANGKSLTLLTGEWPPFSSSHMPDKGSSSNLVINAYAAVGIEAVPGFFNWRNAINLHYTDKRFTALYPVYPTKEHKKICYLSDPIGSSQLGLAQRNSKPLVWRKVEDLKKYRLGTVEGYGHEDGLEQLIQEGKIVTVNAVTDTDNLIHLAQKRIDGVIIAQETFNWLIKNDIRLVPYRKQLQMNNRLLATLPLHVCFRTDNKGLKQKELFNKGLEKIQQHSHSSPASTGSPQIVQILHSSH